MVDMSVQRRWICWYKKSVTYLRRGCVQDGGEERVTRWWGVVGMLLGINMLVQKGRDIFVCGVRVCWKGGCVHVCGDDVTHNS